MKSQHKPDSSRAFERFRHHVSAMCLLIRFSPMVAFLWSVNLDHPITSICAVCTNVQFPGLRHTWRPEAVISFRSICYPSQLSITPGSALSSRKEPRPWLEGESCFFWLTPKSLFPHHMTDFQIDI